MEKQSAHIQIKTSEVKYNEKQHKSYSVAEPVKYNLRETYNL